MIALLPQQCSRLRAWGAALDVSTVQKALEKHSSVPLGSRIGMCIDAFRLYCGYSPEGCTPRGRIKEDWFAVLVDVLAQTYGTSDVSNAKVRRKVTGQASAVLRVLIKSIKACGESDVDRIEEETLLEYLRITPTGVLVDLACENSGDLKRLPLPAFARLAQKISTEHDWETCPAKLSKAVAHALATRLYSLFREPLEKREPADVAPIVSAFCSIITMECTSPSREQLMIHFQKQIVDADCREVSPDQVWHPPRAELPTHLRVL